MAQAESTTRQRKRKNYIDAWLRYRGIKPKELLKETGAGKELAWKWRRKDNLPTEEYLASLLGLLKTDRECLFSPPPGKDGEGKDGPFISYADLSKTEQPALRPLAFDGIIPKDMILEVLLRMEGVDKGKAEIAYTGLVGTPSRVPPISGSRAADDQSASATPRRESPASSKPKPPRRVRQNQPN